MKRNRSDTELMEAMRDAGVTVDQLEVSVRVGHDGVITAGRAIVENASERVFDVLGLRDDRFALELFTLANTLELPMIVGWDHGSASSKRKVYLNASNASVDLREKLARTLSLPIVPHIVGLNVGDDRARTVKLYLQSSNPLAFAKGWGASVTVLASGDFASDGFASAVACWELTDRGITPRAFCVKVRDGLGHKALEALPGCDPLAVTMALPKWASRVVFVGLAAHSRESTVYARAPEIPVETVRVRHSSPAAVFHTVDCEVELFVTAQGLRPEAFARTDRHDVAYTTVSGTPRREEIVALMHWAIARVETAEREHKDLEFHGAPEPWKSHGDDRAK